MQKYLNLVAWSIQDEGKTIVDCFMLYQDFREEFQATFEHFRLLCLWLWRSVILPSSWSCSFDQGTWYATWELGEIAHFCASLQHLIVKWTVILSWSLIFAPLTLKVSRVYGNGKFSSCAFEFESDFSKKFRALFENENLKLQSRLSSRDKAKSKILLSPIFFYGNTWMVPQSKIYFIE